MRRLNPIILFALAAVLALLLVAYVFTGGSRSNPDRINDRQAEEPSRKSTAQGCGAQQTHGLIKRELFRRAAQLRGTDQASFDQLAAHSVLRVESVQSRGGNEDAGTFNCSGAVTLDLPPNVSVVGGRRALTADLDYAVQPSADGAGNIVTLSNAESIITPLAALAPNGAATAQPASTVAAADSPGDPAPTAASVPPRPTARPAPPAEATSPRRQAPVEVTRRPDTTATRSTPAPTAARPVTQPPQQATASPSFNCRYARTASEIAVCRNADLASLDRQMAAQFNSGLSRGTPEQRGLLQRTRNRFLSYRNKCRTNECITNAYSGRMREISDIMNGRWKPN
jgi:hypothetical protein